MDFHRDMGHCQASLRVIQSISHLKGETDRQNQPSPSQHSTLKIEATWDFSPLRILQRPGPEGRDRAAGVKGLLISWNKR